MEMWTWFFLLTIFVVLFSGFKVIEIKLNKIGQILEHIDDMLKHMGGRDSVQVVMEGLKKLNTNQEE